jgi:predicted nucleotidyltransferase
MNVPAPDYVADNEIIRSLVGSTLHGTGRPGHEDTDYMGVCVEPWEAVVGIGRWDQWDWRSAQPNARSGPDDIDITVYGIGKYLRLATKGNPSILLLLFTPVEHLTVQTEWGRRLQELAPAIVSRKAAGPFMGYCKAQRERLEGVRGGRHTNRPELVGEHGYDSKYAMHALRLAYQGQEILNTGRITLPVPQREGDILRAIRRGDVPYDDFMSIMAQEEAALEHAAATSPLPERPDLDQVHAFCRDVRLALWDD